MDPFILTLNAGSSSIKFAVFDGSAVPAAVLAAGQVEGLGSHPRLIVKQPEALACRRDLTITTAEGAHRAAVSAVLSWLDAALPDAPIAAVGHRVVHGGAGLADPVIVDDALMDRLRALVPLAPLHQPHNLAGIEAARAEFPGAVQVACFDTAFHRSHPFVTDTFGLPRQFFEDGVRRYGFHGLSYEFVSRRLRQIDPIRATGAVVVAHLGNGASMCAMRDGRSVASTMGFTALDGLPMGTRCGQLDPGVLLYLLQEKGYSVRELAHLLYEESGLKGISGLSSDMRDLEASDLPAARDAVDYFVLRARQALGAMVATLGELDAVVFCGGIGENAHGVRGRILAGLDVFGIALDPAANAAGVALVSTPESRVAVHVVRTDEEAMIAEHTLALSRARPAVAGRTRP